MNYGDGLIGSVRRRGRKARRIYRYGGAAAVAGHTLAVLGYRRVIIVEVSLDPPPPLLEPGTPVEFGFLQPDALADFAAYRPDRGLETARLRLTKGERCFVGCVGAQIVSGTWVVSGGAEPVDRLPSTSHAPGVDVFIAPDEAWLYDGYTVPDMRGLCLGPASLTLLAHVIAAEGVKRILGAVNSENAPGLRQVLRAGYHEKERMATLALGASRAYRVPYLPPRATRFVPRARTRA